MDVKEKIVKALSDAFSAEYIRLADENRITGFVVSKIFTGVSSSDRQQQIHQALQRPSYGLTTAEQQRVLMIAAFTPEEYDAIGTPIRVEHIKQLAEGRVQVDIDGTDSDAEFVRETLTKIKGVKTRQPSVVKRSQGTLMSIRAEGTAESPLTKNKVLSVLSRSPYIEVMQDA